MVGDTLVLQRREGAIVRVTLNRSQARNALNLPMCQVLRQTFEQLDADSEVRAVLLDASGPAFCAGADLKERNGRDASWVLARRQAAFAAYEAIERLRRPVIALVHGAVVGSGGEIAMSCDFIIAADDASFRFPEPQWGTIGATNSLQRIIGRQ
jgi:enoyl-CoA hydratase